MAGRITPDFKSDLLARIDIVDVINPHVPLKRRGSLFSACCPFHDEKSPSFTVTPARQTYHCFGCGAHGNAIDFLVEYKNLNFPEAVEELARQAGLEIPEDHEAPIRKGPDTRPLYPVMEQAAQLYQQQLRQHPQAGRAVDYLKGRGLSGKIALAFGLGYAPPDWDFLLGRLGRTEQERQHLILAGLVIDQDGKVYDRFRDRVIFPIRDRRGRVIGLGGRILGDGKPKYLNSPETPIFHKGRELYGLHEALKIHRQPERLLVVEGYLDVIALAQFGIDYAVATLGTATTPEHLRLLLPQAPELVFCFDGDRAGREAAWKALETCLPQANGQQEIRFLFLPEGEDPDTLVRQEGREAFEDRIRQATPLSDFLFEQLSKGIDLASLDGRARLGSRVTPLLARLPPGLLRDLLRDRLSRLVGVGVTLPRLDAGTGRRPPGSSPASRRRAGANSGRRPATSPLRLTIALLIQHPELASALTGLGQDWHHLDNPGIRLLERLIATLATQSGLSSAALLERWREEEDFKILIQLSDPRLLAHIPTEGLEPELTGAIQRLNQEALTTRSGNLFNRASPGDWTEEEKAALRQAVQPSQG